MPPIHIRPACSDDLAALNCLLRAGAADYGYDEATLARLAPAITIDAGRIVAGLTFVAESEDGALLGEITLSPTGLGGLILLDSIFVDPAMQRRGIGRQLLAFAKQEAKASGGDAFIVYAHPQAVGFYEKVGARRVTDTPLLIMPELRLVMMTLAI